MPQNQLSISVILTVYNGERFLAEAIQNIKEQNYQPIEIIVVDDGSTDRAAEIAREFQDEIRYIYQPNQGPSGARNRGIESARGEAITFFDVDDLWEKGVLTRFAAYLRQNPEVEIVQRLIQQMRMETLDTEKNTDHLVPVFEPYQHVNLGSALYRRSVFEKVGVFDPTIPDSEDTDWFIRVWENDIRKEVIPSVVLYYRQHDRNRMIARKRLRYPRGLLTLYKHHIDYLRARGSDRPSPSVGLPDYLGRSPD